MGVTVARWHGQLSVCSSEAAAQSVPAMSSDLRLQLRVCMLWVQIWGECACCEFRSEAAAQSVCMPWVQIRGCSEDTQCNTGERSHKPSRLLCAWFLSNFCLPHVQSPLITTHFFATVIFSYVTPHRVSQSQSWRSRDLMSTLISDMELQRLEFAQLISVLLWSSIPHSAPFLPRLVMNDLYCFRLEVQDLCFYSDLIGDYS